MKKSSLKLLGIVCLSTFIAACSSTSGSGENGYGDGGYGSVNGGAGTGYNGEQASTYYDSMYGKRGTEDRIIYFDFDSDRLRQESYNVVSAHAAELRKNPSRGIILEGHTDDRGSREYNIGLGERRAKAVSTLMTSEGVNHNQIRIVSYGKERPAVGGSGEGSWAQNRRVEIIY
ncbi:peptidoglycan-associated lipoprotein Pal [Wohlfahrtiimonas chitiniclastica]|uniref:peptidoglycan-associated lipoprotein Pal n=1 Tax=Wohlfahrtiimonas chitiniclastica TaxID=400946 RepID=UPI000B9821CA|nr:peptidoglycan-associated lipoprotein Pal [Wohlfahrtiimonas chitiniclastica]OYQ83677.1 peptidoglycan-associated lipoprotein [Wohlfahrtiimonas chitiniclastica]OYQ84512.1 peptidoglycan-associated lipoprotein [Wohlfahrtiimonas chitiniclastica]